MNLMKTVCQIDTRHWMWASVVCGILGIATTGLAQAQNQSSRQTTSGSSTEQAESSSQSSRSGSSPATDKASSAETDDASSSSPASGKGIDIEISGGARRVLISMAVPQTRGKSTVTDATSTVYETLRRDLKLSGYFELLSNDVFFFDPAEEGMSATEVNFQNWFNVNAQALVKSEVESTDDGEELLLDLRLFDVDAGKRVSLDWSPRRVSPSDIDDAVHAFTNAVVEHFTGTPGIAGTQVAYVRRDDAGQKQIFVSEIDGTDTRQITDNNSINLLPAWGPNSTIFYTSYRHQNPDLWRWREGTHEKLSARSGQNTGAKYCDGKLALTLAKGNNTDIYTIDADTGDEISRLTDHWSIDTSPTWSPDCSKIAFVSGRSGGPQIYVMNADGSNQRRLTYQGSYNTSPDWSPTGDSIAFTARDRFNRFDVFLVNLDGDLTRLTQDQGNNEQPSFSPDGRYIVFSSDRGGQGSRLWLMTADGEIQHPITPDKSQLSAPAWRPEF